MNIRDHLATAMAQCFLAIILAVAGQGMAAQESAARKQYSDRVGAQRMVKELENLPTGKKREFYRDALDKKGYTITEVDIDTPRLWEVETVKNSKSFVLTVEFDPRNKKSTELLAGRQRWVTDRPEVYLPYGISGKAAIGLPPTHEEWASGKAQLQRTLRPGNEKQWYKDRLNVMDYQITSVNYDRSDYVEYEVVKGRLTYEVQIDFENQQAADVEIDSNWWRASETEALLIEARLETPG